jgi:hypothetical protein
LHAFLFQVVFPLFRCQLPQAEGTGYLVKIVNGPDSLDLGHNPEDSKEVDHDHRDHPDV